MRQENCDRKTGRRPCCLLKGVGIHSNEVLHQQNDQPSRQAHGKPVICGTFWKRVFGALKGIHVTKVKSHQPLLTIEMVAVGFARHCQPRSVSWLVLQHK